jgi:hypothetical protein
MATTAGGRVRFVDGQLLSAADLNDEQEDQIARLRRHAIGPHTWGIVKGGELTVGDDAIVQVEPVFAYDGYGRELVLAEPRALPAAERFELLNTDVLDVWLVYRRDAVDAPLAEPSCDDADRAGRWREVPLIRFTAAAGGPAAARRPPGVPQGDIPFPPSRVPPDDPTREWPVFLGQIHRSPGNAPGTFVYRADGTGRPYVGARAASIEPPWGTPGGTRLDLEPPSGNALEFSVDPLPSGATNPIIAVSDTGDLELDGVATIAGELDVGGGRIALKPGAAPTGRDWRIYQVGARGQSPAELRVEIGASPGRVVVGSWSDAKNMFVPHLTIEAAGKVTVSGDLRVVGDLNVQGLLDADLATVRKAYLDTLAGLTLSGPDVALRTALVNADNALAAALNWP